MKSLFHSGMSFNGVSKSPAPSSPVVTRTAPRTAAFELAKENSSKAGDNMAARRNVYFFSGLLVDYTLFYYILAADVVLTAEMFIRGHLQAKDSIPA